MSASRRAAAVRTSTAAATVALLVAGLSHGQVRATGAEPGERAPTVITAADRVGRITLRAGAPVTLAEGEVGTAGARCRRGETLVGGGARTNGDPAAAVLQTSAPHPRRDRRWVARAGHLLDPIRASASSAPALAPDFALRAYAYCAERIARDRVGAIALVTGTPQAGDISSGLVRATAGCPRRSRLVGGGALGTGAAADGVLLDSSSPHPSRPRRWLAKGSDYSFVVGYSTVQAFAYCAQPRRVDRVGRIVRRQGPAILVNPFTEADAFAACLPGERLVGGGARGEGASDLVGVALRISAPDPNTPGRWFVRGYNRTNLGELTVRAVAFCAKRG